MKPCSERPRTRTRRYLIPLILVLKSILFIFGFCCLYYNILTAIMIKKKIFEVRYFTLYRGCFRRSLEMYQIVILITVMDLIKYKRLLFVALLL